jgi:hypothetical protein
MTRDKRRALKEKRKLRAARIFPNDPRSYLVAENMAFCRKPCCLWRRREFAGPTMRELKFDTPQA